MPCIFHRLGNCPGGIDDTISMVSIMLYQWIYGKYNVIDGIYYNVIVINYTISIILYHDILIIVWYDMIDMVDMVDCTIIILITYGDG